MTPLPVNTNEPGRYGHGTTPAVDAMMKNLVTQKNPSVLIAVNLATLIRNACGSTKKASEAVDKVRENINMLANEVADLCQTKWKSQHHNILFYYAKAENAIPQTYRKEHKMPATPPKDQDKIPGALVVATATQGLLKVLKNSEQTDRNVTVFVRLADKMKVPSYKGLIEVLGNIARVGTDLHLISHQPLDYHVTMMSGRNGYLYRSHTGQVVKMTPSELGKIVFKEDEVPFYPVTHILLGDKELIKGSLDKQKKSDFLKKARDGKWGVHTNTYISEKIKENNYPLPYAI